MNKFDNWSIIQPIMGAPQEGIDRRSHKRSPLTTGTETDFAQPSRERFALQPTHIQGVSLRTEPGFHPNVPESVVEALLADAKVFKEADAIEKAAARERNARRDRILPLIRDYPGLRGIVSEADDVELTATPNEKKIEWIPDLVRESLPRAADFHEIVTETVIVEFPKPAGRSLEVITSVMADAIQGLGKGILKTGRASVTVVFDINEKKLASRLKALGRKLLPGARTPTIEFSLSAGPVVKNPPKKGAAEAAPLSTET